MIHTETARYSIYFAPRRDSELGRFGEAVLQRTSQQPRSNDAAGHRWQALTSTPAHYGFHATLKAPFELAEGFRFDDLVERVRRYAASQSAIELTGLAVRRFGDFAALALDEQPHRLQGLAIEIVRQFEDCRKPLSQADIQRRMKRPLTERQLLLLDQYGYPFVDDEFRFHMTLSGTLDETQHEFMAWLTEEYERHVSRSPSLDQLTIYGQPDRLTPFVELLACPLG